MDGNQLKGWVRARNFGGGWDGWISLSGTTNTGGSYGPVFIPSTKKFSGYAWGDEVVGWVDLSHAECLECVIIPQLWRWAQVTVSGNGQVTDQNDNITCGNGGSDCSKTYDKRNSTEVILTATAPTGNNFEGWSGVCTGTQQTCTLAMTADRSVTADFALILAIRRLKIVEAMIVMDQIHHQNVGWWQSNCYCKWWWWGNRFTSLF